MTEPTPTPGAPETEPTATATIPAPSTETTSTQAEDVNSLPDWAQKLIRDARADAAKSRTTAKQTAADEARQEIAKQVAKALGLQEDEDTTVDPEYLTEQIQQAQARTWRLSVESNVHRIATRLGADPERLLDSNAFIDTLDDLVEDDPLSDDFRSALEAKIQAAIERNPLYRGAAAAPTGPRPDRSQGQGGGALDLDARIAQAQKTGDWRTALTLQNQKIKFE